MNHKLTVLITLLIASCGGDPPSSGMDAGPTFDAGTSDAGGSAPDAARDAGHDAGEPCFPGETRFVDCGLCGAARQDCQDDGLWGAPGTCSGEGVCIEGEPETEMTPACGERTRRCTDTCTWGDWVTVVPDGDCEPGEVRRDDTACGIGQVQEEICQDSCTWGAPTCVEACGPTRRTSPADAEEVCIPGGPFNRGVTPAEECCPDASPMREVLVSPFFLDRYPVTNERYQQCIDAGACPPITGPFGGPALADPTLSRNPVSEVPQASAEAFCAWDGGRRLPTEAEWEKAARGPAPRVVPWVWGDDDACEPYIDCREGGVIGNIDSQPLSASYYGVERLVGGGLEWVSDLYSDTYYATPGSLVDPTGPTVGSMTVRRGWPHTLRSGGVFGRYHVYARWGAFFSSFAHRTTFRCARTLP